MLFARSILFLLFSVSIAVAQLQPNQDYLRGRNAEKSGDIATATASYQAVVSSNSLLKEYALWRLARIARSTGDLVLERERLQRLIGSAPNSLLFETAALRLSESFFESSDFEAAANSAKLLASAKNVSIAREAAALMGSAFVRAGKPAEAREVFTKLVMQMPDASRPDDFALSAVRGLDALDKSATLSEQDHRLRASVYQFNRDFAGARAHYQALVESYPQSGTLANAIFQLGRGYYLEYKYDDAIKAFQKVIDTYPQAQVTREAVGYLGSSYLRMKRTDDAVAAYKLLIDKYADTPNPERAYLNIIDALHEAGRHPEALNWVQQTRARFKNEIGGTLALFAQLRIHLAQASWAAVASDADELLKFSDLGGTRVAGGTSSAEVSFLRGFALEQAGRFEEAIAGYLAIPDGRNEYYGARATQRLLALASGDKSRALVQMRLNALLNEAKVNSAAGQWEQARVAAQFALRLTTDPAIRIELLKHLRDAYDALSTYRLPKFTKIPVSKPSTEPSSLADALLSLELYDEAVPELLAAYKTPSGPDEDYTIAALSLKAGLPNRAVRFAEQVWKIIPADYVIEIAPRELIEQLYPVAFQSSLLKHAAPRNVDPRFLLAIARQESRFRTDAKSVAAARGMMQFIPSTANDVAAELKLTRFEQDDLYNADTAILFGAQYLSNLFKQFPDQPQAVAGSYNGGADNLARWIARSRSNEADRYVPEIGFSQTKDYVYKVLTNFWNYQRLYDAQLQPISSTPR
ncbi:MAG TPA: transglycosylase SLT domain-containing protein [Pyrinomonadaceae bacterium]|nr:transglycosylase SLT domain-containing protein [Pyrinomonadaceae bacterium]